MRNVLQRSRDREKKENNRADHAPDNGTRRMSSNGIERNRESQDVTPHRKDQEDDLRGAEELFAKSTHKHLSRIRHVVDMWIGVLELPEDVACVRGHDSKSEDQDHAGDHAN